MADVPSTRPDELNDVDAATLVAAHGILSLEEIHNAALVFQLGDGRKLTLWEGDRDHGRFWEVENG